MAFVRVCSFDDLWEGDMDSFQVDGVEILLVHLDGGEVVATQAICPHQQFELVDGEVTKNTLTCKAHLWQFDLKTCRGINPSHAELANYPVKIDGDDIYVDPHGDIARVAHS